MTETSTEIPDLDDCMGYESLDVFAQQFICKSDSRDYYAELRKDIKKMKCQS